MSLSPFLSAVLLAVILLTGTVALGADVIQARAAIQINSIASGGSLTSREIVQRAREHGFSVVVFTERDLMKWQYGVWPLRRIVSKTVEQNSLARYGAERYLTEIGNLRRDFPDMVILTGVESAPFYWWEGSPWKGGMVMHDWHKQIIAVGLKDADSIRNLPVIGNERGLREHFQPFLLWPAALVGLGALLLGRTSWCSRTCSRAHERSCTTFRVFQCLKSVFVAVRVFLRSFSAHNRNGCASEDDRHAGTWDSPPQTRWTAGATPEPAQKHPDSNTYESRKSVPAPRHH